MEQGGWGGSGVEEEEATGTGRPEGRGTVSKFITGVAGAERRLSLGVAVGDKERSPSTSSAAITASWSMRAGAAFCSSSESSSEPNMPSKFSRNIESKNPLASMLDIICLPAVKLYVYLPVIRYPALKLRKAR